MKWQRFWTLRSWGISARQTCYQGMLGEAADHLPVSLSETCGNSGNLNSKSDSSSLFLQIYVLHDLYVTICYCKAHCHFKTRSALFGRTSYCSATRLASGTRIGGKSPDGRLSRWLFHQENGDTLEFGGSLLSDTQMDCQFPNHICQAYSVVHEQAVFLFLHRQFKKYLVSSHCQDFTLI